MDHVIQGINPPEVVQESVIEEGDENIEIVSNESLLAQNAQVNRQVNSPAQVKMLVSKDFVPNSIGTDPISNTADKGMPINSSS